MNKKCVIYTRVSHFIQAENGMSLEVQEQKARKLADYNDWQIKGVFSDKGISGRSTQKRVGLKNAMDSLEKGNFLIIYSISRLSRNVRDALDIMKKLSDKGVELVSITEEINTSSASGKAAFGILLVMAELESDMISERIKGSMELKKAKKQFVGRPPYGWRLSNGPGSNLEPTLDEQEVIERIKEYRKSPDGIRRGASYQTICDILNNEGIPCRKAKCFTPVTIKRILERGEVITKGRNYKSNNIVEEKVLELPDPTENETIINESKIVEPLEFDEDDLC